MVSSQKAHETPHQSRNPHIWTTAFVYKNKEPQSITLTRTSFIHNTNPLEIETTCINLVPFTTTLVFYTLFVPYQKYLTYTQQTYEHNGPIACPCKRCKPPTLPRTNNNILTKPLKKYQQKAKLIFYNKQFNSQTPLHTLCKSIWPIHRSTSKSNTQICIKISYMINYLPL